MPAKGDGSRWIKLEKSWSRIRLVQRHLDAGTDSSVAGLVYFKAVITTVAWRSKPTWALVAGADRTINPDLERWYATRANSHKVEVAGASHAVYVSRPKEVAALIEEAATHTR
jgi:pimeloyl-ACP methyl ester carboxylesterase